MNVSLPVILLRMAAEIPEITDSNQEHIYSDLHECLRILTRLESLLVEFQPLLAQFRSPAAAYVRQRAALKAQLKTIQRRSKYREEDGNG